MMINYAIAKHKSCLSFSYPFYSDCISMHNHTPFIVNNPKVVISSGKGHYSEYKHLSGGIFSVCMFMTLKLV